MSISISAGTRVSEERRSLTVDEEESINDDNDLLGKAIERLSFENDSPMVSFLFYLALTRLMGKLLTQLV